MAEKIISTPTLDDDCDMITFIRDKGSNNFQTEFGQGSDSVQTVSKQGLNNFHTAFGHGSDRNKTENARANKGENETIEDTYRLNTDIINLLKNNKFIYKATNKRYSSYRELPYSGYKDLHTAVVKSGFDVSKSYLPKIVLSMKFHDRIPKYKAVCLAVVVCFFSAFATLKISQFEFDFGSVGGGNGVLTSSFGGGYTLDIDKHINDLAKENRVTIYPFRRNKIKKEIQLSGDNSLKNIELIINNNINELKTLTK